MSKTYLVMAHFDRELAALLQFLSCTVFQWKIEECWENTTKSWLRTTEQHCKLAMEKYGNNDPIIRQGSSFLLCFTAK